MASEYYSDEFSCPNCGTVIGSEENCAISFGCIVRKVMAMEYGMKRGLTLSSVTGNVGDVPGLSDDNIRELFTSASINCTAMPPIISALRYNLQDIRKIPKLLKKETHLCSICFDSFIDVEERNRLSKAKRIHLKKEKRLEGIPKSLIASQQRRDLQAFKFDERNPDVTRDMTFTNLQSDLRQLYRNREVKEIGKELILYSRGGDVSAYEGDSSEVAREMRRIAFNISRSPSRHGGAKLTPLSSQDTQLPGPGASGAMVHSHGCPKHASHKHTNQDASSHGLGQSEIVAFDVSLDERLMSDLYEEMTNVCEFSRPCHNPTFEESDAGYKERVGSSSDSYPYPRYLYNNHSGSYGIPKDHPLYQVYKNNGNRLPEPPVPYVCLEIPLPSLGTTAAVGGDPGHRMPQPSAIRCLEEHPKLDQERKYKVTEAMKIIGLEELTGEQVHLLDDVLQDSTIPVPDDDDDDDDDDLYDDDDGSEYDSEETEEEEDI